MEGGGDPALEVVLTPFPAELVCCVEDYDVHYDSHHDSRHVRHVVDAEPLCFLKNLGGAKAYVPQGNALE
ncbi:hypothetical protein GCM10010365_03130 [Streptomyces poonensis]|uniref:Uncharacterized protein n=1 Tax=Streptomyces poonensis TaxID=68255 RepID=A0A918UBS3_9ACTN|nr:hypothetical protein GCM10010365_03130 [Streptomyces poonensis]